MQSTQSINPGGNHGSKNKTRKSGRIGAAVVECQIKVCPIAKVEEQKTAKIIVITMMMVVHDSDLF